MENRIAAARNILLDLVKMHEHGHGKGIWDYY